MLEEFAINSGRCDVLLDHVDVSEGQRDADQAEWDVPPGLVGNDRRRESPEENNEAKEEEIDRLSVRVFHLLLVQVVTEHGQHFGCIHEDGLAAPLLVLEVFLNESTEGQDEHSKVEHTDALEALRVGVGEDHDDDTCDNENERVDDLEDAAIRLQQGVEERIDAYREPHDPRKTIICHVDGGGTDTEHDQVGEACEDPE